LSQIPVSNISVNFSFFRNFLTHVYKFRGAMQHSHRHIGIRKPLNLWGNDSYTLQTLACTKAWLRQANKCILFERTVILAIVLSETSLVFIEHANCLINVNVYIRFIHDICNIIYVTYFLSFVYTSLF